MNNLEELHLIIRPPNIGGIIRDTSSGIRSFLHGDLDSVLGSLPKFGHVNLHVDSEDFIDTNSQKELQLFIEKRLPLVCQTKHSSLSFSRNFDWRILL